MKRWTVMMIPHDRGTTRNLDVAAYQVWVVVVLIVGLSFSSSFLFKRHQVIAVEAERLRSVTKDLERQCASAASMPRQAEGGTVDADTLEQVRAEYEASVAAITAELTELYEVEAEAREMTGLAPRKTGDAQAMADMSNGKGGPPVGLDESPESDDDVMARPANLIYGLSRPSADLIVQEINLRTDSLRYLVEDLYVERDRVERTPSIWPTASANRRITSRFGYRKDPFTRRVRHHDGTDITGPYASPIVATAKGVVTFAGREAYYGNMVKIDHGNGLATWYAHLKKCLVNEGDTVNRSDPVGTLGNTGRTTGAHVHYEVHVKGKPVDSGKYLRD